MANYHKRNSIRAVQWDPENAQSFEDIKKLVAENPGLGWKVRDNIIHNCVTIYSFALDVLRIRPSSSMRSRLTIICSVSTAAMRRAEKAMAVKLATTIPS